MQENGPAYLPEKRVPGPLPSVPPSALWVHSETAPALVNVHTYILRSYSPSRHIAPPQYVATT